ncbi:hypothetical protein BC833DRAFT_608405 [Globomyces pollinis-pini]|nr:hypothetical protein BC833DRAFT_608405 [Globomyces pollinis-pini]
MGGEVGGLDRLKTPKLESKSEFVTVGEIELMDCKEGDRIFRLACFLLPFLVLDLTTTPNCGSCSIFNFFR